MRIVRAHLAGTSISVRKICETKRGVIQGNWSFPRAERAWCSPLRDSWRRAAPVILSKQYRQYHTLHHPQFGWLLCNTFTSYLMCLPLFGPHNKRCYPSSTAPYSMGASRKTGARLSTNRTVRKPVGLNSTKLLHEFSHVTNSLLNCMRRILIKLSFVTI